VCRAGTGFASLVLKMISVQRPSDSNHLDMHARAVWTLAKYCRMRQVQRNLIATKQLIPVMAKSLSMVIPDSESMFTKTIQSHACMLVTIAVSASSCTVDEVLASGVITGIIGSMPQSSVLCRCCFNTDLAIAPDCLALSACALLGEACVRVIVNSGGIEKILQVATNLASLGSSPCESAAVSVPLTTLIDIFRSSGTVQTPTVHYHTIC
jgi:hypothetical protein